MNIFHFFQQVLCQTSRLFVLQRRGSGQGFQNRVVGNRVGMILASKQIVRHSRSRPISKGTRIRQFSKLKIDFVGAILYLVFGVVVVLIVVVVVVVFAIVLVVLVVVVVLRRSSSSFSIGISAHEAHQWIYIFA